MVRHKTGGTGDIEKVGGGEGEDGKRTAYWRKKWIKRGKLLVVYGSLRSSGTIELGSPL